MTMRLTVACVPHSPVPGGGLGNRFGHVSRTRSVERLAPFCSGEIFFLFLEKIFVAFMLASCSLGAVRAPPVPRPSPRPEPPSPDPRLERPL